MFRSAFAALQIALVASVLAGCNATTPAIAPDAAELPAGAIAIGDDLYMVPAGVDGTECPWFRAFSPTKMVVQAMFYRAADGDFVIDRAAAACAAR